MLKATQSARGVVYPPSIADPKPCGIRRATVSARGVVYAPSSADPIVEAQHGRCVAPGGGGGGDPELVAFVDSDETVNVTISALGSDAVGQCFILEEEITLDSFIMKLRMSSSPPTSGRLVGSIWSITGTPGLGTGGAIPDELLATSELVDSQILPPSTEPTIDVPFEFAGAERIVMPAGAYIAVCEDFDLDPVSGSMIQVAASTADLDNTVNRCSRNRSAQTWSVNINFIPDIWLEVWGVRT